MTEDIERPFYEDGPSRSGQSVPGPPRCSERQRRVGQPSFDPGISERLERVASCRRELVLSANFCQSRVTALQQLVSSSSAARRSHQVDLALLGRSLQGRDRRLVRCDADSQAPICTARAVPFVCAASPRESAVASSGKNRASIRSA
jgi:hypothetical protein